MITDIGQFTFESNRLIQSYSTQLMMGWVNIGNLIRKCVLTMNEISEIIGESCDPINHIHIAHMHASPHRSLDFNQQYSKNRLGYFNKLYTKMGAIFAELLQREINTQTFDADDNGIIINKHFIINPEDTDCPPLISSFMYSLGNFELPIFSWKDYLSTLHPELFKQVEDDGHD